MGILGFNFNLVEQLTFYGSYHSHPLNQLIHFIFVPALFWTALVWLAYTPTFSHCDLTTYLIFLPPAIAAYSKYLLCNGTAVLVTVYSLYYVVLEPFAGATWALFMGLPMWATANNFQQEIPHAWAWAVGLHIVSWAVQVYVGHTVVEKRRPALLDSFFQSLVLAPLFVWFEALFLLGYRPQLREEVAQGVGRNIAAWKDASRPLMTEDDDKQEER